MADKANWLAAIQSLRLLALGAIAIWFLIADAAVAETPRHGDNDSAHASIVQGTTAAIASFPWLAHVTYKGPVEGHECTGTVISPQLVLTAGHCVLSEAGHVEQASNFTVITGVADRRSLGAEVSHVVQVLVFPEYNLTRPTSDAGLLVLEAPVRVPALALAAPSDESLLTARTPLAIAGWGLVNGSARRTPAVLRHGQTVVQSARYCRTAVRKLTPFYSTSSQLCAVSAPSFAVASCHGDSGGPGIAHRPDGVAVEVGIISLGSPRCNTRVPEVLTRVDRISPWATAWIDAVEHGGPEPEVRVPVLHLPRLSIPAAKLYSFVGLAEDFRNHFLRGKYFAISCRRIEREKVKCRVFWYLAGYVYRGAITAFYALPREGPLWNYTYRIRKINAYCWFYSRRPHSCPKTVYWR